MQKIRSTPNAPVTSPNEIRQAPPRPRSSNPQRQTVVRLIAPTAIGRSFRYWRSNSTSKASLRNIPPRYRNVAPTTKRGSASNRPPPPSHHPARQLDHTVGRLETRPRTRRVRGREEAVVGRLKRLIN